MNNNQGALGYGYIDTFFPITSRPNHQDDGQLVRLYYGDWVAVLAVRSSSYLVCTEKKEEVWVACDQVKLIITPDLVDKLVGFLGTGVG